MFEVSTQCFRLLCLELPLSGAMKRCLLFFGLFILTATASATSTHTDITVLPANANKTIFEEGSFRRTCRYTGSSSVSEMEILHNGTVVDEEPATASIMLDVAQAELSDTGSYTCRVVFSVSSSITADMGTLTVVDLGLITAPPDQYVVEGGDISLECFFDNPGQVYGTVITTIRRGGQTTPIIAGASMADEGDYRCDITLITHDDSTQVPIRLHVFTPINITDYPEKYQELDGVQEASFSVLFTGRQSQGVAVKWFRNGIELFDTAEHSISTAFSETSRTGNTTIHFPEMERRDNGVYRVLVTTDFGQEDIDLTHRRDEESFQVRVVVPPPDPDNFRTTLVTEHQVTLQWELTVSHSDQDADSFQLQVSFPNGSTAHSLTLESFARSAVVSVFPGVTYDATLTASNTDGPSQSTLTFSTPPAAPYVTLFEVRRLNETHFNISISLLYTGGGETTIFSVYFREQHTISWSFQPVMRVSIDSSLALEYHGVISGEEMRGKGPLEFELRVENGEKFVNRTGSVPEISDLPGAFKTPPVVADTSDTSVTLDLKLPDEGTPPFINIVLEFSEPQVMTRNFTGSYHPGEIVVREVRDLSPRTAYSLKARAVNYAGDGPSSETINFTTNDAPPTTTPTPDENPMGSLMMPIIYGGAGGLVVVVLFIVIPISIFCCCYCHKRGGKQKEEQNKLSADAESGHSLDKEMRDEKCGPQHHSSPATNTLDTLEMKQRHMDSGGNVYIPVPQHDRRVPPPPSVSPSVPKWRGLERGHNQASSSTLNSGGSATQDSFTKKQDVLSTDSAIQLSSLQSSQPSQQTSRDSLGCYRRGKVANPSISSGGSETTTETTERYQITPLLMSSIGETYSSSQTVAFTPRDLSYTSLPYSDQTHTPTQYSIDHQPCTDV